MNEIKERFEAKHYPAGGGYYIWDHHMRDFAIDECFDKRKQLAEAVAAAMNSLHRTAEGE